MSEIIRSVDIEPQLMMAHNVKFAWCLSGYRGRACDVTLK